MPGYGFEMAILQDSSLPRRSGTPQERRPDRRPDRMRLWPNISHEETFDTVLDAYRAFDDPGWTKVAVIVGEGSEMQVSRPVR
jgi:hypothetical protein